VFTDVSGRRRRRLRRLGVGLTAALLGCLTMMAVALLGGPGASVLPWDEGSQPAQGAPGSGGTAGQGGAQPSPTAVPSPEPLPPTGPAPSTGPGSPSARGSSSPSASHSPSPVATNRAGHTPPGRNRVPRPKHTHAG